MLIALLGTKHLATAIWLIGALMVGVGVLVYAAMQYVTTTNAHPNEYALSLVGRGLIVACLWPVSLPFVLMMACLQHLRRQYQNQRGGS